MSFTTQSGAALGGAIHMGDAVDAKLHNRTARVFVFAPTVSRVADLPSDDASASSGRFCVVFNDGPGTLTIREPIQGSTVATVAADKAAIIYRVANGSTAVPVEGEPYLALWRSDVRDA